MGFSKVHQLENQLARQQLEVDDLKAELAEARAEIDRLRVELGIACLNGYRVSAGCRW